MSEVQMVGVLVKHQKKLVEEKPEGLAEEKASSHLDGNAHLLI